MLPSLNNEKKLSFVIGTIVLCIFITNFAFIIQNMTGIEHKVISNFCKFFIFIAILSCAKIYFTRFNTFLLKFFFFITVTFLINELLFGGNEYFYSTLTTFLTIVLPTAVTYSVINDYKETLVFLRKVAITVSVILLFGIITGSMSTFDKIYAMGFSNSILLPTTTLMDSLCHDYLNFNYVIVSIIAVLINLFSVVVYGSRGSLVVIIFYFLFVCVYKKLHSQKVLFSIVFFLLGLSIIFLKDLLLLFHDFLIHHGYSSRTIDLFVSATINDSRRLILWNQVIDEIIEQPFEVRGINADFLLIDTYSHNYFIELIYDFGVLIGGVFTLYIVVNIIKSLNKETADYQSRLETLLLFSFFPICLWSGSVWLDMYFWSWFAVVHTVKHCGYGKTEKRERYLTTDE